MYSNNILDFQESPTILNACTKKSGNLFKALRNTKPYDRQDPVLKLFIAITLRSTLTGTGSTC